MSARLRLPPRRLLALIVSITVVPLLTLLWVGWRLFEQDRFLEERQVEQYLDRSAELAAAALDRALSSSEQRLAAGARDWPAGAVSVVLVDESIQVWPADRAAFLPVVAPLPQPPDEAFAAGEHAEHRFGDTTRALQIYSLLSDSSDAAIRAGALLRLGRLQYRLRQRNEALATYERLATIDGIGIADAPAALAAIYLRSRLFESERRADALRREGQRLLGELNVARWPLTAAAYELYRADATRWAGASRSATEGERLGEALTALWNRRHMFVARAGETASGRDVLVVRSDRIVVLWQASAAGARALLATPLFAATHWLPAVDEIGRARRVSLSIDSADPAARTMPAVQSGLPWDLRVASLEPDAIRSGFARRRRWLAAGFLVIVALVLTASYVIGRSVSRELAVAQLQSDFVATVSHEFRTPLTTLRQFTERLREHPRMNQAAQRQCFDAQSRAADRLTRLVETLLDFGRLEARAHSYHFESQDCAVVVRRVVDDVRADVHAAGHDIRFRHRGDGAVRADVAMLSQAVRNLIDNAVKYSPGASSVEVEVRRDQDSVVIDVTDQGIGIPAHEQAPIFAKFHRGADARSLGITGTGLGLAMVDRIVRAHRGRVQVQSQHGRGSTFSIRLPALSADGLSSEHVSRAV
jgi:signal transduction histidine kinase